MTLLSRIAKGFDRSPQAIGRYVGAVGDIGLGVCLLLTPLLLGGRHDFAALIYAAGATAAATGVFVSAKLLRQDAPFPGRLTWIAVAVIALLVLQITHLSPSVREMIGPNLFAILPLWGTGAPLGDWNQLSVTPAESLRCLAIFLAHLLFFVSISARLRGLNDVRQLVRWIGIAAITMAAIGVAQHFLGNGKLLWVYDQPRRVLGDFVQGSFDNKNHFAHFLLLGLGPAAWIAVMGFKPTRNARSHPLSTRSQVIRLAPVALIAIAILASQSRGAVIAAAVATPVGVAIGWRGGLVRRHHALALSAVALIALAGVSVIGFDSITSRMHGLVEGDVESLDHDQLRRSIWTANIRAFVASPLVGFGAGSHREVYPLFFDKGFRREFTHAESGYLQVASETGAMGLTLLLMAIGIVATGVLRGVASQQEPGVTALWAAIVPSLVASVVHSVVDFVWYLPGLLAPTLALIAAARRLERHAGPPELVPVWLPNHWPRACLAAAAGAFAITILFPAAITSGDWDHYLRVSRSIRTLADQSTQLDPDQRDPFLTPTILSCTDASIEALRRVVRNDPSNARARLRLAKHLLHRYDLTYPQSANGMPLELIADAAMHGGFASHREMQHWLDRALGEHAGLLRDAREQAQIAVRLCPLLGEGYMFAGRLSFLDPAHVPAQAWVDQALAVRPYDGDVLFEAGRFYWLAQESAKAMSLWQRCTRMPGSHLGPLVCFASQAMPAREFIEQLDPGLTALDLAIRNYSAWGSSEDLGALCRHVVKEATTAEQSPDANSLKLAYRWRQASETLRQIGEAEQAILYANRALELAPNDFYVRLEMATAFHEAKQDDEADPHIRWLLARKPNQRNLRNWLQQAAKNRITASRELRANH